MISGFGQGLSAGALPTPTVQDTFLTVTSLTPLTFGWAPAGAGSGSNVSALTLDSDYVLTLSQPAGTTSVPVDLFRLNTRALSHFLGK